MTASAHPGCLPVMRFDTRGFAPGERLDAWQAALGGTYAVGAERKGFAAKVDAGSVDRMVVMRMDCAPLSLARTPAQIRRDGLEHVALHLNAHGYRFASGNGEGGMNGGEISVNDLSRPFQRSAAAETGSVVVALSRELVEAAQLDTGGLHGTVLSGSAGALLAEHMRMLGDRLGELPAGSARPLAEATVAMLAAALGGRAGHPTQPVPTAFDAARLLRAKRHIRAQLHRHDLTPDAIARALHLSRTKLFALFEGEGGVERYLLHRRLAVVADALRDPRETRPIALLAYAHGFASPSHFARAFRARYGATPSGFRAGGAAAALPGHDPGQTVLAEWLRRIG